MFKRSTLALDIAARLTLLALAVIAITAGGCAGLGLAPAESFNDRVGYALGVHTAVLETATEELEAGALSSSEAEDVAELADRARALIDTAREVHAAGRLDEASRTLSLALTILQELQAYLRE